MGLVKTVTAAELEERRRVILDKIQMTVAEIKARADAGSLVGDEWSAWDDLRDISYLLGERDASE